MYHPCSAVASSLSDMPFQMILPGKNLVAPETRERFLHVQDDVLLQILPTFALFFAVGTGQPVAVYNAVVPVQSGIGNEEFVALGAGVVAYFVGRVHRLPAAVTDLERQGVVQVILLRFRLADHQVALQTLYTQGRILIIIQMQAGLIGNELKNNK